MIIAGEFSFNGGREAVNSKYKHLLYEIHDIVSAVDANEHKTKTSEEQTMPGKLLYSPDSLNEAFRNEFDRRRWQKVRVRCEYSTAYYTENHQPKRMIGIPWREMDFVKEHLGVEVQFGKYSFMVYNICGKMTIFKNLGFIDTGLEIVVMKRFADEMSSGVSYFEQLVWDLEKRGVSDIDIPVLVLGIDASPRHELFQLSLPQQP